MKKVLVAFISLLWIAAIAGGASAKVVEADIAALYLFDEEEGDTVKDWSANKNDGKITGDLKRRDGKYGKGLEFGGVAANYVEVPDSESLNLKSQITIAAWVWLVDTGGNRRIVQKSTPGSDNQYRLLLEWGSFKFDAGPGVAPKEITTAFFPMKEWHHVAGAYDGKKVAIYYDGEEQTSQNASGEMTPTTGPLYIGTKHPGAPAGDCWNGVLDEVGIFNRGLTADEIKEIMGGVLKGFAVDVKDKLAVTWGRVKAK